LSAERRPPALATLLVALYPEAWRARYREEMFALLVDDPPGSRELLSLVRGAVAAHLRPRTCFGAAPEVRMRLSVGALFACWLFISVAGMAFAKVTENAPYNTPFDGSQHHLLIGLAHGAVIAGALLGASAVAVGGLPLLWPALRRAAQAGELQLRLLLALPPVATATMMALAALLFALAPARGKGFPATWVAAVMVPLSLGALAWVACCWVATRGVLARVAAPANTLRRAAAAGSVLALAMCVVVAGFAAYTLSLWRQAPSLSALGTGPYGASTWHGVKGQGSAGVGAERFGRRVAGVPGQRRWVRLTFAGWCRMTGIRRELPRSSVAGRRRAGAA
jgi:hypothetical protein